MAFSENQRFTRSSQEADFFHSLVALTSAASISALSISKSTDNAAYYLKLPKIWFRNRTTSELTNEWTNYTYYWCSDQSGSGYAYRLYMGWVWINNMWNKSFWLWIRTFKDTPVVPTSSWTTIFDWSSIAIWAWIFHNSTLWLISLSSDWTNWITIADKNLWATTVWNRWDTLTDANCWYFYQWGNNYWFPHSWSVTTSSTTVDASWYWPWNYYSSSTFIVNDSKWDKSNNANLWWAVTWTVQLYYVTIDWTTYYEE